MNTARNARQRAQPREPAGAALRAAAARALVEVAFDGRSLRELLARTQAELADPRDRALLAGMLYAATRWWLRHERTLAILLERPLPVRARPVQALLVLGLAQLVTLVLPPHAAVTASVDACRLLGFGQHGGLVNAVLRRFLREREAIEAQLDADEVARTAHPRWLIEALRADWPEEAEAILAADNHPAPLVLRVNRRRCERAALRARFAAAGIDCMEPAGLPDALELATSTDVRHLPGYAEGLFSVQDGAAQGVVELMALAPGLRVLDACAAPGGKAAHMLERFDLELVALDRDPARVERMRGNFARLGLAATLATGDATQPGAWWDGRPFERILLDAPCSATGILRRQPDVRLHRRAADIPVLAAGQAALLEALWPLLAPGGRLAYVTCSVLRAENEAVLAGFLARHADAHALPLPESFGHACGPGRQRLPGEGGMDGFHHALLAKRA